MFNTIMNHFSADGGRAMIAQVANTNIPQVNNNPQNTVTPIDIIDKYLNTLNSSNTRASYKKSIEDFFSYMVGDRTMTLDDFVVDPSDTIEYVQYLKDLMDNGEIKSSTYNKKIQGVRKFYDWLMVATTSNRDKFTLITVNPFYAVKQVSENDSEGSDPLTDEEIMLMLRKPYGSYRHIQERNKLIMEVAIITGIRRTALINSTIDDIKEQNGVHYMDVVDKNKKTVKIQIDDIYPRLIRWYNEDVKYRKNTNTESLFNISTREANRIILAWAKKVGINKKITFHSFRTTTAVKIYENNDGNIYKAQMALNHNSASITKRYLDKANSINTSGNTIISDIQNSDPLYRKLSSLDKNQIISMIMESDISTRMAILQQLD